MRADGINQSMIWGGLKVISRGYWMCHVLLDERGLVLWGLGVDRGF